MDMEHIPSTYETLYHARANQPVILNQHTVRNNSGHHNQGCLCWNERSNGVASLCMGLLCVLLLACIITQHFIYNSGHKQLESVQNLTLQRDNLLKGLSKVDEQIQSGWWYYNSSVYYISKLNEKMKWTDSRQNCKARGADLVVINSWAEQKFIEKLSSTFQMDVWIGLTDRDNLGVLTWVDGFPLTFRFWGPNQPANRGFEVCVQQKNIESTTSPWITGNSWETSLCTCNFNFICEKKIFQ